MTITKTPEVKELKFERPERYKFSPEEALKRMQEFASQRKKQFIAAGRQGKG